MTKLEMCREIFKPKTKAQEWFVEKAAKEHSKPQIEFYYNKMKQKEAKEN